MGALLGLDPTAMLRADPLEREVLTDVLRRTQEFAEQRDRRLAQFHVDELAKAYERGRRRG